MKINIIVPAAGESVTEADISSWYKSDGDYVELDEPILELETDKASLEITAEIAGILSITIAEGTVKVGDILGSIEESAQKPSPPQQTEAPITPSIQAEKEVAKTADVPKDHYAKGVPSPAAATILKEKQINPATVTGTGKEGRITKEDALATTAPITEPIAPPSQGNRSTKTEPMSRIRKTIMKRLVATQQTAALLSTFNEVDLSEVMTIRKNYKEAFKEKYEVGLGFMSFFTKATCMALQEHTIINSRIEEDQVVYHDYCDIGIAVATPKGLVVPVVRNAETLSFHDIEKTILGLAKKGRNNKLTLDDMQGGTFTITNGGVFGSMMSTPIINAPQSAILGMHNIVKRAVVINDEIQIRPMMYLAVSYDHRIIDGSDAVRFLVKIKELLEDPHRLLIGI